MCRGPSAFQSYVLQHSTSTNLCNRIRRPVIISLLDRYIVTLVCTVHIHIQYIQIDHLQFLIVWRFPSYIYHRKPKYNVMAGNNKGKTRIIQGDRKPRKLISFLFYGCHQYSSGLDLHRSGAMCLARSSSLSASGLYLHTTGQGHGCDLYSTVEVYFH